MQWGETREWESDWEREIERKDNKCTDDSTEKGSERCVKDRDRGNICKRLGVCVMIKLRERERERERKKEEETERFTFLWQVCSLQITKCSKKLPMFPFYVLATLDAANLCLKVFSTMSDDVNLQSNWIITLLALFLPERLCYHLWINPSFSSPSSSHQTTTNNN